MRHDPAPGGDQCGRSQRIGTVFSQPARRFFRGQSTFKIRPDRIGHLGSSLNGRVAKAVLRGHADLGLNDDLEGLGIGGVTERLIGCKNIGQRESVGDHLRRVDALGLDGLEQHRNRKCVDQAGREGHVV